MEQKFINKYTYTTTFLYVMYFSFLTNHAVNVFKQHGMSDIWQMFSISGVYFSVFCVLFYTIKKLLLLLSNEHKKLHKIIPFFNQYSALVILLFMLFSHYLSTKTILLPFATQISFFFPFHEYFILFLLGLIFFCLGLYSFKTSHHKILGVALIILFLNGLYLAIIWHSFSQQRNLYQDLYSSAAQHVIYLSQCDKKTISCFKLKNDQEVYDFLTKYPISNPALKKANYAYLDGFISKIIHSKQSSISYSYGNSVYQFYYDYKAIGVYNRDQHVGILDYQTLGKVEQQSIKVFFNIIGVATFLWFILLLFLLATHHYIKYYFTKKAQYHA